MVYHAERYYVFDSPEISDFEYDRLYSELQRLEAEHPEYADPLSPTQRVGGAPLDKFEKVVHTTRMDSLSDVFSYEDLKEFVRKITAEHPEVAWSVEPKIDGLSVSLIYEEGGLSPGRRGGRLCRRGCYTEY